MTGQLRGVTPPKVVYPCCHCCHPADFDALGYTVGTPGCAREDQDRHPYPCLMCGQRRVEPPQMVSRAKYAARLEQAAAEQREIDQAVDDHLGRD